MKRAFSTSKDPNQRHGKRNSQKYQAGQLPKGAGNRAGEIVVIQVQAHERLQQYNRNPPK